MLRNHLQLHVAPSRRANGRSLGNLTERTSLLDIGEHLIEKYFHFFFRISKSLPWLSRIFAGLSPRMPEFESRPFHGRFMRERMSLGQGFLRLLLSPVCIISRMLYARLRRHVAVTRRTNGRRLRRVLSSCSVSEGLIKRSVE
jgi:hypothetical protein